MVNGARMETYPTIKEQIGHWVDAGLMSSVPMEPFNNRKVTIRDMNKSSAVMLNNPSISRMIHLFSEIGTLVLDKAAFRLLILVLLTNGLVSPRGRAMQSEFLNVFRRRMQLLIECQDDDNGVDHSSRGDELGKCIGHVKEMSVLANPFKDSQQQGCRDTAVDDEKIDRKES
jgi:hypothetical protein